MNYDGLNDILILHRALYKEKYEFFMGYNGNDF